MELKILIIVVVFLTGVFTTVLNIVRLKSANNPTPQSVSDVYDAETYAKWKKYSAEHSVLNLISDIIGCIISLCLLATNAYAAFASLFPKNAFLQLLAVILLEIAVSTVVGCVVSYISNMRIEEKYGFNKWRAAFDRGILKNVFSVSSWMMLQPFLSISVWFFFFIAVERLGERQLAVVNLARALSALPFIVVHAYAVTAHKSQGSEYAAVIIPVFSAPQRLLSRNLLYTAVTRAKRLLVMVGREEVVQQMVETPNANRRYSALRWRVKELME